MDSFGAAGRIGQELESLGGGLGDILVAEPTGHFSGIAENHGSGAVSMTQTVVGGGILAALFQAVWMAVAPAAPPIIVHSLTYSDGTITQDRTVTAATKFTAVWTAEIVDATTGAVVPGCSGGGSWDYVPGRRAVKMTVQEWVGSAACNLPVGQFYPRSTYRAGEFYISERGDLFEVEAQ